MSGLQGAGSELSRGESRIITLARRIDNLGASAGPAHARQSQSLGEQGLILRAASVIPERGGRVQHPERSIGLFSNLRISAA